MPLEERFQHAPNGGVRRALSSNEIARFDADSSRSYAKFSLLLVYVLALVVLRYLFHFRLRGLTV